MNLYRQRQQILLVSSTHGACFGGTDHPQGLNTWYLLIMHGVLGFKYHVFNA